MQQRTAWWRPLVQFIGHTFVGLVWFAIIAAPALGLNYLVEQILKHGLPISAPIVMTLQALEYFLLLCDLVLFVAYFLKKTYDTAAEFWSR